MKKFNCVPYLYISLLIFLIMTGCASNQGNTGQTAGTGTFNVRNEKDRAGNVSLDNNISSNRNSYGFAVFKVTGESTKNALAYGFGENTKYGGYKKVNLYDIKIENVPLLTDADIEYYDWQTQTIKLNTEFLKANPLSKDDEKLVEEKKSNKGEGISANFYGGSKLLKCSDMDAVLIVLGDERIYAAGFALPAWSSRLFPEIYIEDSDLNSVKIKASDELSKIVQDKRIHDFFKKAGKLK